MMSGEWNELEELLLRHVNAEEMFLLPAFSKEEPTEASVLRAEHTEIRKQLGEIGLALDLHSLRLEQIDDVYRAVARHIARETRTLYPWADQEKNRPLVEALARRLPQHVPDRDHEARTTATLLALLKVCHDGERGYWRAVGDTDDPDHRKIFSRLAEERARFAREARAELKNLGVAAHAGGTLLGTLHRTWIEVNARLPLPKSRMLLRECERGEQLALRVYRNALRTDLPAGIRSHVESQRDAIERTLQDLRALAATAK
jgi:uncharacterized protein (TIGR02284 family)